MFRNDGAEKAVEEDEALVGFLLEGAAAARARGAWECGGAGGAEESQDRWTYGWGGAGGGTWSRARQQNASVDVYGMASAKNEDEEKEEREEEKEEKEEKAGEKADSRGRADADMGSRRGFITTAIQRAPLARHRRSAGCSNVYCEEAGLMGAQQRRGP